MIAIDVLTTVRGLMGLVAFCVAIYFTLSLLYDIYRFFYPRR